MDEAQNGMKSDDTPSMRDGVVKTRESTQGVDKNEENQRRGYEDDIRQCHLDDLLSFKKSPLEVAGDGPSSELERFQVDPAPPQLGVQTDPTTRSEQPSTEKSSDKMAFALIILNQVIDLEVEVFMNLFIHCKPPPQSLS